MNQPYGDVIIKHYKNYFMKILQLSPLLFESKIDCLFHTDIRFLESKSTLPQQKISTQFRR